MSKHIKILQECDVVEQQKQGKEIYYLFKATKLIEIEKWLNQLRKLWDDRFQQLDHVLMNLKKEEK